MINEVSTQDGSLNFAPSDTPVFALGPAAQGSTSVVNSYGDPSTLYSDYDSGKLPDRTAFGFGQKVGPFSCLRIGASTAGALTQPAKTPATAVGVAYAHYGAIRVAGVDLNGNVFYQAKDPDVTLTIVNDGTNDQTLLASAVGKAITIRVATNGAAATTTTGNSLTAYTLPAEVAALLTITKLGTGASVIGVLATTALSKGGLTFTPKQQYVRFKTAVAAGAGAALAISDPVAGTDAYGNATQDITITLGTDANTQPDPTKNTATLVKTAMDAKAAVLALITTALAGDGTGHIGQQTSFAGLTYGSTGWIAVSGSPVDSYPFKILITRAGGVGVGAFKIAMDVTGTYGAETAIPGGGTYAIPGTGITLTFTGTFDVGDLITFSSTGPTSTAGDLTTALGVLSGLNVDGGEAHICGGLTGAMAASIISWLASERAASREWVVFMETRDRNTGETAAQYKAALLADFAGLIEPNGCLVVIPGWWNTVLQGNRGIMRRSFAWAAVTQIWRLPYWVHPSSRQDGGGALPGLYTPTTPGTPDTHDERLSPGLGGSGGRFMTVQSLPGAENLGLWFVGDAAGLRSPGTFAAGTSDFSLLMYARTGNRCRRAMLSFGSQILASRYPTKTSGALTDASRKKLNGKAAAYLKNRLGEGVVKVRVEFSSTENLKVNKRLAYTAFLDVYGYALKVNGTVAIEPVT